LEYKQENVLLLMTPTLGSWKPSKLLPGPKHWPVP